MWQCPGPWSHSKCFQTMEVRCLCLELKPSGPVCARLPLTKCKRGECSNIKVACQCTDWLSAMQNGQGATKSLAPCWNRTSVAQLTAILLNHYAMSLYQSIGKKDIWLVILSNLEPIFCVLDSHSVQVEYHSQTRYTRVPDSIPFIQTFITLDTQEKEIENLKITFYPNFHRVGHTEKRNWELEIQGRSLRSSYWWVTQ